MPGAGKTTLVASYAVVRAPHAIWYRVTRGDADPALIVSQLKQWSRSTLRDLDLFLPDYTPDWREAPADFACAFFHPLVSVALKNVSPERSPVASRILTLVLDDFHEAGESEAFCDLVCAAIECLPAGARMIVASRSLPPPAFARMRLNGGLREVGPNELLLTLDEAMAMAAARSVGHRQSKDVRRVHSWSGGWVGGFMLALDANEQQLRHPPSDHSNTEALFSYFATQSFAHRTEVDQEHLVWLALLPQFTAEMAEALCGTQEVHATIAESVRRNEFLAHTGGPVPIYAFHALYRDFLLVTGKRSMADQERASRVADAACLMAETGQVVPAFSALLEIRAWEALADLVRRAAGSLYSSGQQDTLAAMLARLPTGQVAGDGWLLHWQAACVASANPGAAVGRYRDAYLAFEASGEVLGRYLAWSGAVEAIALDWSDFAPLDEWIERGDALRLQAPRAPTPEAELRFVAAMLNALQWRRCDRPDLNVYYDLLRAMLAQIEDDATRVLIGSAAFFHAQVFSGSLFETLAVLELLRPRRTLNRRNPLAATIWKSVEAHYAWSRGEMERCRAIATEGVELARRHGIRLGGLFLRMSIAYSWATSVGGAETARRYLAELAGETLLWNNRLARAHVLFLLALAELETGHADTALSMIREANQIAATTGGPQQRAFGALAEAQILHALSRHDDAREQLMAAKAALGNARYAYIEHARLLCEALIQLEGADGDTGEVALRRAFELGRRGDILNFLWFRPSAIAKLCAHALVRDIEPAYVERLIQKRGLIPPGEQCESWPWPIRIHVRGGLRIQCCGRYLNLGARRSAPLRLLEAIVRLAVDADPVPARGTSLFQRPVSRHALGSLLRPGIDAASTQSWIDQNLHRLRALLGAQSHIVAQDGFVALDPRTVWVDIWGSAQPMS
ncbi:MAG: hypothetical protein IT509_10445 [Rhodocyclaceae bacterium]|nr:hypothetical protein [Rhodocyclaceae bacterium]